MPQWQARRRLQGADLQQAVLGGDAGKATPPRCGRRKSRGQGVAAGATVALLLARSLVVDWVAHRLGRRVHEIKAGSSAKAGAV